MSSSSYCLTEIQRRIDEVKQFLSITLNIANAHTVEFYTQDAWNRFTAVPPQEVLSTFSSCNDGSDQQREPQHRAKDQSKTTFGFCNETDRLVDACELLLAARAHSLPGLGVCMSRDELLQALRESRAESRAPAVAMGAEMETDEFMNSKKSHEVQSMSEVVACLAQHCGVIDVGSGKGYLSSFLSLQYGLHVYAIDSSSSNTHGAQERNRKLKKFSRAYQKHNKAGEEEEGEPGEESSEQNQCQRDFSPLTSYVTAETELRELIDELEDAVMVGLHTCGDLAPSTLRMFVAKPELSAVCSVGCCYHLLESRHYSGYGVPSSLVNGVTFDPHIISARRSFSQEPAENDITTAD
ncbi:hypothetical protein KUCAC02_006808 [Chaenocephalus aceratus]|uniref:Uncharacterized protein n=1 Tax=Chaenocephalus aceratus TaxID=36190 RepID=A0ACB9VUB3_CHAAC|nr:hypothetical protein KUCAC02_006808 [Chaenocephalus aceratus]